MSTALHDGNAPVAPFIITVSARALFDLEESHRIYEEQGIEAFSEYQRARENEPLKTGPAYPLVKKFLDINQHLPPGARPFEVVLLSRNSADTALRVFNAIEDLGLPIVRAVFTSGASTAPYAQAMNAQLFLSSNSVEVRKALDQGIAAATIIPSRLNPSNPLNQTAPISNVVRIAFDGDAVLFSDEAENVHMSGGLDAFHHHEVSKANIPLPPGPYRGFLEALHTLQQAFPENCPIRTALVTARSAPAHKRAIMTLREWGVRVDEAMFLGGRNKGPFLRAFGADMFFDDSQRNVDHALDYAVASAHVPHGVRNVPGADERHFTGGTEVSPLPPPLPVAPAPATLASPEDEHSPLSSPDAERIDRASRRRRP